MTDDLSGKIERCKQERTDHKDRTVTYPVFASRKCEEKVGEVNLDPAKVDVGEDLLTFANVTETPGDHPDRMQQIYGFVVGSRNADFSSQ